MTTPFVLVKSPKSTGIAILLTILFGPVGLFYASVTGGIMMTFIIPVFLIILNLAAASEGAEFLQFSLIITILVFAFYWLICIIWAVTAVNEYNRKIEEEYTRQQQIFNDTKQYTTLQTNTAFQILDKSQHLLNSNTNTNKPNLQDWMKENPGKGINDYFMKFGK